MPSIRLDGTPIHTAGTLPALGTVAPPFLLAGSNLGDVTLESFKGRKVVMNIFPTLDTGVCQAAAKTFDARVADNPETALLYISADLPIGSKRYCDAHQIQRATVLSTFRSPEFGHTYGVLMIDGGMRGLLSRAVLVLDRYHRVVYTEQVPDIGREPDYDAALRALSLA